MVVAQLWVTLFTYNFNGLNNCLLAVVSRIHVFVILPVQTHTYDQLCNGQDFSVLGGSCGSLFNVNHFMLN